MGATPVTDDVLADFFDGLVNAAIQGGEDAAKTYIAAQAPFLELPVISVFTNEIISLLGSAIYSQSSNLVAIAVLDVQTNLEKSAVGNAITYLQSAQASGDKDAIASANSNFNAAVLSLMHSDGSANPPPAS
jgi:hypothetical protein